MDQKEVVKNFYLFTGVSSNDLDALDAITERRTYTAGELLFSEGVVADALFIIEAGTVNIVPKGKEVVFATLGSGQGFGELAFFDRGTRPASASACEAVMFCGYLLSHSLWCSPIGPTSLFLFIVTRVRFLQNTSVQ